MIEDGKRICFQGSEHFFSSFFFHFYTEIHYNEAKPNYNRVIREPIFPGGKPPDPPGSVRFGTSHELNLPEVFIRMIAAMY
jgi:hypothetical protein